MKAIIFFNILFLCSNAFSILVPELLINQKQSLTMEAGKKAIWTMNYTHIEEDMTMRHKMFMSMHAKKMHMIIISKDLSHLAHIHPYLNTSTGEFKIDVNTELSDFDNQDTKIALPFESDYFVFSEVMPMFHDGRESSMLFSRFQVKTTPSQGKLTQQKSKGLQDGYLDARFGITKYFKLDGKEGAIGDALRVEFKYEQFAFCDRYLPKFYFSISRLNQDGEYIPVPKFDRWLGMGGHAILISAQNRELRDKTFHHLHAFLPMATKGKFAFPYHDHVNPFLEGNYKIWSQMRIGNQVYKFPFPFKYTLPVDAKIMATLNFCFK